ncbi:MAG: hypothetical protein D6773_12170 [Alphaproteobacteria bacterium]|nr:MAG: hypothetical protein D6773_12170 [Alphaproteobacteria bacterium]
MLDDFFIRALAAAGGLALVAGPLGCFVVWRRMAYFGATLAHAALLGVALGLLLQVNAMAGVFLVAAVVAPLLLLLERHTALPADTLLGILAHGLLATGLVVTALMTSLRLDLMAYLFGDVLAVSKTDVAIIYLGGGAVLATLALIWRPLLAATVSAEIAKAEGLQPERTRLAFLLLVAAVIAIAMKIVGVLLIVSLLIIPAATARRFAATPETMAIIAAAVGLISASAGLFASLRLDTPSGPSIVVAATLIFLASLAAPVRDGAASEGAEA